MELQLILAAAVDAQDMLTMQKVCFKKHFERYHDLESPYNDTLEKMLVRINFEKGCYLKIVYMNKLVGGVWVFEKDWKVFHIGIIYILPEYQSKGIGQKVLEMVENYHTDAKFWELDCPEDLSMNRRCYEKAGYKLTGENKIINENLSLVYYRKESSVGM